MLFHHKPVPSSWGLNAGGDGKRGRKGRLVEEWRNIISMRSRRGFVLCRLPSAPSTFLLSLFPEDLETLSCQSSLLQWVTRTGPVLTSTICANSDSAFLFSCCFFIFIIAYVSFARPFPAVQRTLLQEPLHRMSVSVAHLDSVWPATSQQRGPFPFFAVWGLLVCAAEPCRCFEGGSLRMTGFVRAFETNNN